MEILNTENTSFANFSLTVFIYLKSTAIFIFKIFCIIILIYQIFEVTKDYLSYPFEITIMVNNAINEYELPSISICTESKYIWNKTIIHNKFPNLTKEMEEKKIQ